MGQGTGPLSPKAYLFKVKGEITMPGSIIGIIGKQRSGKTLIAYKIAKGIQDMSKAIGLSIPVYTNLWSPQDKDFQYVNSIDNLPLNLDPKIVLIDEIYNGCDAQDFRKLKDISIFINTIGKQNCLFIYTSIDASMVYNRLRNQQNLAILVKADSKTIHYKLVFLDNNKELDYQVLKTPELFENVNYDTNFIPLDFDWGMDSWKEKLEDFYQKYYGISTNISK